MDKIREAAEEIYGNFITYEFPQRYSKMYEERITRIMGIIEAYEDAKIPDVVKKLKTITESLKETKRLKEQHNVCPCCMRGYNDNS